MTKKFRSPKEVNGKLVFKEFKKGDFVTGKMYDAGSNPFTNLPIFKTKHGYMIPESFLNIIDEEVIEEAVEIKDEDFLKGKLNLNNRLKSPMSIFTTEQKRSKYTIYGSMIGGLVGLSCAMYYGKSKPIYALIGLIGGGAIGNSYNNLKNE
jgi:hypothetical protein